MIKIFHMGDNHLDSPFSRLSPSAREKERERQRALFKKMVAYVKENRYDILLISGDLFDTPDVSYETEKAVIEAFSSLECPVVIAPGNHDPYLKVSLYSSDKLPENVYVFNSTELQVFEFEELSASVVGYAFTRDEYLESPFSSVSLDNLGGTKLLCAHCDFGVNASKYAPISESELISLGFAYAALGHVHKLSDPIRIGKGLAAYCGFPEGRAFDEEGAGGALAVTVDGDSVTAERVIFAERRYLYDALDISGAENDGEIVERIASHIGEKGYDSNTALRLTLLGTVSIDYTPDKSLIEHMLLPYLMSVEIIDKTIPEIDEKSLENDYTLRGEVYRALKPKLASDDPEEQRRAAEALKVSILAIEGRRISFE